MFEYRTAQLDYPVPMVGLLLTRSWKMERLQAGGVTTALSSWLGAIGLSGQIWDGSKPISSEINLSSRADRARPFDTA